VKKKTNGSLHLAPDFWLAADYIVGTAGIFATKGMGKTHIAQVLAEEMLKRGQPIVVIDPTDAWHGLRSSADGKSEGYPIVVIGGDHGDLPLEPGAAVKLAEAVVAERFSCVICTDGLSDAAEARFVREFLDTIYRKNRKPLHIFVDEADIFAPSKPFDPEDARCIRAMSHIVRRGRKKGIGTTLITQRPAELNASVRTMIEMLFVLGMLNNLDIEAVERWMRLRKKKRGSNASFELQEEMIESLDTLQRGDAWAWAPRLGIHKRFRAREKITFDSGATPKPGQRIKAPKKFAPVDLQRLGDAMTAAVERQKANDPTELRKQVATLRKELERTGKGQDRAESNEKSSHKENFQLRTHVAELERQLSTKVKERTIEVIKAADLRRVEALVKKIDKLILRITGTNADLELHLSGLRAEGAKLQEIATRVTQLKGKDSGALVGEVLALVPKSPVFAKVPMSALLPSKAVKTAKTKSSAVAVVDGEFKLLPAHLRILTSIAWWESVGIPAPDLTGVAFIAKTTTSSSAFNNNRSRLNAAGYIHYPMPGHAALLDAGRAVAPPPDLPPTDEALQETILAKMQPAVGKLLRALIETYPKSLPLEDWATAAGTSTTSSAFNNNRSWLKARGLATYPQAGFAVATKLLFPEEA
jgi:hypothetical protein